jgi:hypothetical protein
MVGCQNGDVKAVVSDEAFRSVTCMDLNAPDRRRIPVNELE